MVKATTPNGYPKAQGYPEGRPQHCEDRGLRLEPGLPRRRSS